MPEHTIAENLTRLQNAKTAIGNAITAKGGTVAAGDGLEEFTVDIATITNQYTAADEGKVVSSGSLVAQTSATYTENATYDTTFVNSVTVDVPSGIEACELIKSSGLGGKVYGFNTEDRTIVSGLLYKTGSYSSIVLTFPQDFTPRYTKSGNPSRSVYYDYGYGTPYTVDWPQITDSSITLSLNGFTDSSQTKQVPICIQFNTN